MSATDTPRTWAHYTEPDHIDVDGVRTAFRRAGNGERVAFLHGEGFTRTWLPFCDALAQTVDLVAPEHPGFGDSELPDAIQSFDDLVLHYDALLRALELDAAHIVGHGLGGWLAADLAVFYPTRFKSLTLINPMGLRAPGAPTLDPFRMTPEEKLEALFNGRGEAHADLLEQEGDPDDMIRALMEAATTARLMWNPRYDHRLEHRLRRVSASTLIIAAEDDRIVPGEVAARYAELIPGSRREVVAGPAGEPSGHLLHIEHPQATADLIASHVAAHA